MPIREVSGHSREHGRELTDGAELTYRPSPADLRRAFTALTPARSYFAPRFYGLENIPADGPVLLVGNHTLFGVLDAPLMVERIYRDRGRFVRSLAENAHYAIAPWSALLQRGGAVRGTRDNCRALLAAGETVLVFPGGGREVAKRKGEKYQLIWKQRTGFARMAIEAGCPIVPFGAVGAEECFDIVADADHRVFWPARRVVEGLGGRWELAFPLVRGVGPSLLPRPARFYFGFGAPIGTATLTGRLDQDAAAWTLREQIAAAVTGQIAMLQAERDGDPQRHFGARLRASRRRGDRRAP